MDEGRRRTTELSFPLGAIGDELKFLSVVINLSMLSDSMLHLFKKDAM